MLSCIQWWETMLLSYFILCRGEKMYFRLKIYTGSIWLKIRLILSHCSQTFQMILRRKKMLEKISKNIFRQIIFFQIFIFFQHFHNSPHLVTVLPQQPQDGGPGRSYPDAGQQTRHAADDGGQGNGLCL